MFIKLPEMKYSFTNAVIISSILFGVWHIVAPARSLLDGKMSTTGSTNAYLNNRDYRSKVLFTC
ncbi:MAG: hypothetical protein GX987_03380 [Tissierellia bacterium]|nr:hypothetical protein [Tissierellia bacterium]